MKLYLVALLNVVTVTKFSYAKVSIHVLFHLCQFSKPGGINALDYFVDKTCRNPLCIKEKKITDQLFHSGPKTFLR